MTTLRVSTCIRSARYDSDGYNLVGKELRLKQQYFWTAASLADILRRFKNIGKPISEFPDCKSSNLAAFEFFTPLSADVAIQLNDVSTLPVFCIHRWYLFQPLT
jgi:glucan phosphorylase